MNNPFNNLHAATGPAISYRGAVGMLAFCCALMGGVSPAVAGPGDQNPPQSQRKDENRNQEREQQRPERDPRAFEARAEEHRRVMQENANNADMSRRVGRMTADERRDLRRQINEAGMEIYSQPLRR